MAVSKIDNGLQDQINDLNSNLNSLDTYTAKIFKVQNVTAIYIYLASDGRTLIARVDFNDGTLKYVTIGVIE